MVVSINSLIGTWIHKDDLVEYTVSYSKTGFSVKGIDTNDGEEFCISDIHWDGEGLHFTSLMPSTGYTLKHIFRTTKEQELVHTFTCIEKWTKKLSMQSS